MNKKVTLCCILKDLWQNVTALTKAFYCVILILPIILSLITEYDPSNIIHLSIKVIPTTLGFTLTAFALIWNTGNERIEERLMESSDKDVGLFETICSTFIISMMIQVFTLILTILCDPNTTGWINYIVFGFVCLSFWSLMDTIIVIYTLRTLIVPRKEK